MPLATRLAVLRDGVLEQTGTPEEVYTNPASAYVAGFMSYRNLLPARVDAVDSGRSVRVVAKDVTIDGTLRSGDVGLFTPGTIHRAINDGDLRVLVMKQNGGRPEAGDGVLMSPLST